MDKFELMRNLKVTVAALTMFVLSATTFTACKKDKEMKTQTLNFPFNTGQVGAGTAYSGSHPNNLTAKIVLTELEGEQCKLTVSLMNSVSGKDYNIHVHDAADPTTTPNGTPYNEAPNASILSTTIAGNGGTATKDYTATNSYNYIVNTYGGGFLVVHDPDNFSTTNLTTYLVVASFNPE
jgi:hypothetical protein